MATAVATTTEQPSGEHREQFLAFVGDTETYAVIDQVVGEMMLPHASIRQGSVKDAVKQLGEQRSPKLLLIDVSGSDLPLSDINALADVCEPGVTVLAVGDRNDCGLFRDLLQHGVADYLVKPITPILLQKAILAATDQTGVIRSNNKLGKLVAVTGTRGGVGATTVATSVAWLIAQERRRRVALVDLDLQFGTVALSLDLEPSHGLREALENPNRIDGLFMDRVLIQHSERLFVLSAEESPDETLLLDYGAVELLMTELRNKFHYVIVDVPRSPNACTQQILQSATDLLLVTDLSLAGMRDTMRLTGMLPTTNASCNTTLVVNRVGEHKQGEMPRAEFEKGVSRKLDLLLPFDAKTVAAATNFGQPVAVGQGSGRRPACARSPGVCAVRRRAPPGRAPACGRSCSRKPKGAKCSVDVPRRRRLPRQAPRHPPRGPPRRAGPPPPPAPAAPVRAAPPPPPSNQAANEKRAAAAKAVFGRIQMGLLERIDASAAAKLSREELQRQIAELIAEIVTEEKLSVTSREQQELTVTLVDDMVGFGPLEPLLADETVNDIMVNGPHQVYVERKGKLELTDIRFRDNGHVMNIAQRIVTRIGRRVDETCPIADARLPDGSRVNIIAPPLAIDGCSISIRKFSKKSITLDVMIRQRNMAENLGKVLKIAAACRLNVVISGGTGSGKTTMLNAMSHLIDPAERVVTIEDAAELQLQQPHVVRLETRPPNLEGTGEITMRDLVKNALRMRPDRIICGEVRGPEALDMLQAMNTGHDGSMCTLHANNPREALTRMENMIGMASV